jgi:hypothetical protein
VREEVAELGKKPEFFGSDIGDQGDVETFVKRCSKGPYTFRFSPMALVYQSSIALKIGK